jgi:hypothetical protein
MNALTQRILALSIALTLILAGCGTELGGVLYIVGNTVPESSTCLVQAQGGGGQQKFRPNGVLDLSVTDRYKAYFMVVNEAPQFESVSGFEAEDGRLDQSKIMLDTAIVKFFMSQTIVDSYGPVMNDLSQGYGFLAPMWDPANCDGSQCYTEFSVAISVELLPGATGAAIFDLLPANYGRIFRQLPVFVNQDSSVNLVDGAPIAVAYGGAELDLLFEISVAGKRHDGVEVSSELFRYPVKICNNCLVMNTYPRPVALNPLNPGEGFEPITAEEILGDACAPGSDEEVPNAWCGLMYAQEGGAADPVLQCRLNRCLDGVGDPAPGGAPDQTLYCDNDGVSFGASAPSAPSE